MTARLESPPPTDQPRHSRVRGCLARLLWVKRYRTTQKSLEHKRHIDVRDFKFWGPQSCRHIHDSWTTLRVARREAVLWPGGRHSSGLRICEREKHVLSRKFSFTKSGEARWTREGASWSLGGRRGLHLPSLETPCTMVVEEATQVAASPAEAVRLKQ